MGDKDKKKHKDKKDKKKYKDKDRQRKDKKKKQKKRSYSSSSSSGSSDSQSSSSRQKSRRKDKKIKKQTKQKKAPQTKVTNPYDFDKTVAKPTSGFQLGQLGVPSNGFNLPLLHPTPPPPISTPLQSIQKPKTKQINIFKLLPKLPFGAVLFAKTLYSTEFIQEKAYNVLLETMCEQLEDKAKEQGHKKALTVINKCSNQIKRQRELQEQQIVDQKYEHIPQQGQQSNRFQQIKNIYQQMFPSQ